MKRVALSAILLVLVIAGAASYLSKVHRAQEATRAEDARAISSAVRDYTVDMGAAPKSLDELVVGGYLKAIPGQGPVYWDPVEWPDVGRPRMVAVPAK